MRQINIFISSTFKDMDAERDLVVDILKPAIEQSLRRRHVDASVQTVDLRWGVNTQDVPEDQRENKVLSDCLDYIRDSRPFFIGFLGDRYGWVPPRERWDAVVGSLTDEEKAFMGEDAEEVKSVTELEILFGVLKERKSLPSSFFFMRNPASYEGMDPSMRAAFCDADPALRRKLDLLKEKIRTSCMENGFSGNVIDYDCKWDGRKMSIEADVILQIVEPIVKSIMSEIVIDASESLMVDDAIMGDSALLRERNSYFCGREEVTDSIAAHIDNDGRPLVILSPDGSGKTSILCHLFDAVSSLDGWIPLIHFTYPKGPYAFAEVMLKKMLRQIPGGARFSLPMQCEANPALQFHYLKMLASQSEGTLLILIDDIQYLRGVEFIAGEFGNVDNVRFVVTTDRPLSYLRDGENAVYMSLPPFSEEETRSLTTLYMESARKSLPSSVVEALIARKLYSAPLWTTLTLNHLVCLDIDDYTHLRAQDGRDDAEKITQYLLGIVADTPDSLGKIPEFLVGKVDLSNPGVCKLLAPVIRRDYNSGVVVEDSILIEGAADSSSMEPIPDDILGRMMARRCYRLAQAASCAGKLNLHDAAEILNAELKYDLFWFTKEYAHTLVSEASGDAWGEMFDIFRKADPGQAFLDCLKAFEDSQSLDDNILLCISYYHLASVCESRKICPDILEFAFDRTNSLIRKSLISVFADGLYYSLKSDVEKLRNGNLEASMYYQSMQEKCSSILAEIDPESSLLRFYHASRLDEISSSFLNRGVNAIQQKKYAAMGLRKNERAVEIFREIYKADPSNANLADLTMAEVRGIPIQMILDKEAAKEKCDRLISCIADNSGKPGMARQLAAVYDYKARIISSEDPEKALGCLGEAYDCLLMCHDRDKADVEIVHSIATVLKSRFDIFAACNSVPDRKEIDLMRKWVSLPLETNPNDFVARTLVLSFKVLDTFFQACRGEMDGLPESFCEMLEMAGNVAEVSNTMRYLELRYVLPVLEYILKNAPADKASAVAAGYESLKSRMTNQRIVSPDYFPPIGR